MILEICVDDVAGLEAAVRGGADRIELCAALSGGGVTPSVGFMHRAAAYGLPVSVMIRPRAGDFVFTRDEADVMKRDIDAARAAGLSGVVLGASREDGSLDLPLLEELRRHANGLDVTLHRAFDVVPAMDEALEAAVALGFSRILTSRRRTFSAGRGGHSGPLVGGRCRADRHHAGCRRASAKRADAA
ncbi:UNVERIFIED_ORG: copper homeostasis protein CutC [Rhizobium sp. SORGH_AS260]|nr:copper homeostasis protein CutC [Rhizobium sp. SORGH_AS_0260]